MKKNSKIDSNLICVGSVGKSKGLKGEFRLNSYCLPKENILTYSKLKIEGYDTHSIEYIKSEKNHFIAKLKEINDIESISKLTNSKIYIYKDDLPDLKNNEFYWHELIGMNVVSSIDYEDTAPYIFSFVIGFLMTLARFIYNGKHFWNPPELFNKLFKK